MDIYDNRILVSIVLSGVYYWVCNVNLQRQDTEVLVIENTNSMFGRALVPRLSLAESSRGCCRHGFAPVRRRGLLLLKVTQHCFTRYRSPY